MYGIDVETNERHYIDFSQICSEQQLAERTDNCTFECIKVLYEKKFCSGVPTGQRIIPVQPKENDIFGSLMRYNVIGYNASSERVLSTGSHHGNEIDDFFPKNLSWRFL